MNAVEVSKGGELRLAELKTQLADVGLDYVIAMDQSIYTLSSANAVMDDLVLAVLTVGFVMLMFLHSLRSSLFVLVACLLRLHPHVHPDVPVRVLLELDDLDGASPSWSASWWNEQHSRAGEHLPTPRNGQDALDLPHWKAARRSDFTFAMAIALVDVVVFLPMAMAGGLIGNILREFSLVVVFSTLMSSSVAFTLTPLLASRWGKLDHSTEGHAVGRISLAFESSDQWFPLRAIRPHLQAAAHTQALVLTVCSCCSSARWPCTCGIRSVGATFVARTMRIVVFIELSERCAANPTSTTDQLTWSQAERIILKHPEVVNVFASMWAARAHRWAPVRERFNGEPVGDQREDDPET